MSPLLPVRSDVPNVAVAPMSLDSGTGSGAYPETRGEEKLDLRLILGVMRRYWLLILFCALASGGAGWFATDHMTPTFETVASLRIAESESAVPGLELLKDLGGRGSEVNTEMEVLKSRAFADSVVARLGLRLSVVEPRRVPRSRLVSSVTFATDADTGRVIIEPVGQRVTITNWTGQVVTAAPGDTARIGSMTVVLSPHIAEYPHVVLSLATATRATRDFMEQLQVTRPSREANVLTVRFRHPDRQVAEAAPNALLAVFLTQRVGTRRTGARSTVDFLRKQMDTLGIELRGAEDSLRAFREQSQVVAIETQAEVSVGKLAELKAERDGTASELQAIDSVLAQNLATPSDSAGGTPYRRLLAFPTLLRNATVTTLLTALNDLENQRATLLTRRTMRDPDVATLTGQINGVEGQIRSLVISYTDGLRAQVSAYDRTLALSGKQLNAIPAKEVQLARLMRSTTVLGDMSTLLQTRLKEAEISQAVEDPSAQVIDTAVLPEEPVSPRRGINMALSLMLGLVLSGAIVFTRESFDTKLHSREELQRMSGVPVLGVIPRFRMPRPASGRRLRGTPASPLPAGSSLVASNDPASTVLEAYRALRTNLAFSMAERAPKIVVVTSSTPGDGKSTTTANLAASLAQQHLRVLVIDADMRRGLLHRTLGGTRRPGLSEILVGQAEPLSVVQSLTFGGIGQIDLISTGMVPPNPAELLSSPRLHDLLEAAEPLYDTILIDTPPVNHVADALIVAPHADGVLLVARGNKTDRAAVRFAMEQLSTVRAKVMGTILNDFDVRRAGYGGYGYYAGYGYAADPGASTDN